jgi:hypothetical protein
LIRQGNFDNPGAGRKLAGNDLPFQVGVDGFPQWFFALWIP